MKCNKMQGISLVEVLVAFGVLCIVLLGVVKLSLSNVRIESLAMNHSIASMRVNALFERLRVNWQPQAAADTINQWNQNNLQMLPLGHGSVSCNPVLQICTVQITWDANGKQAYAVSEKVAHVIANTSSHISAIKVSA